MPNDKQRSSLAEVQTYLELGLHTLLNPECLKLEGVSWDHLVQPPRFKQGQLEQVAQE